MSLKGLSFLAQNNFSFDFLQNQKPTSSRSLVDPAPEPEPVLESVPVEVMLDTMFDIFMKRFDILEAMVKELRDES